MRVNEQDPPLIDAVEASPAPQTLLHIRRGAFPLHWGMITANDGSILVKFLAKMQELK